MTLDTKFAAGMRQQLIETAAGYSPLARRSRRTRLAVGVAGAATAVALLTAGAVVAAALVPGEHELTFTGGETTMLFVGSDTVDVAIVASGEAINELQPNAVRVTITCTSAGAFVVAHPVDSDNATGTEWECGDADGTVDVGHPVVISEIPLVDGRIVFDVTTDPATTWTALLQFMYSETTEWGVNANGQTYGTENEKGRPDLISAQATNGLVGWSYWTDFESHRSDGDTFAVYESDGETVIGEFRIGNS